MVYCHPQGRKNEYWGKVGEEGKKKKNRLVARLSSLTVPSPGWPSDTWMSQLCTDVSHNY